MAELGKIETKRMYGTTDGRKFDTLEEAQVHSSTTHELNTRGLIKAQVD